MDVNEFREHIMRDEIAGLVHYYVTQIANLRTENQMLRQELESAKEEGPADVKSE